MKSFPPASTKPADNTCAGQDGSSAGPRRPHWDGLRRELKVDGQIVKRFRLPAANQEAVLVAFEEEGWPSGILDPLPPQDEQDCKQRLHDTIKALNHSRLARVIRFRGDGTGEGVLWEWSRDWH
jgi:hypothetical protein